MKYVQVIFGDSNDNQHFIARVVMQFSFDVSKLFRIDRTITFSLNACLHLQSFDSLFVFCLNHLDMQCFGLDGNSICTLLWCRPLHLLHRGMATSAGDVADEGKKAVVVGPVMCDVALLLSACTE